MAVAYKKEEMLSASKIARSFGQVLSDLSGHRRRRVVVVKNNHLEAVLLPVEDYETMAEALNLLEHIEIYRLVQERKGKRRGKTVGLNGLLKEEGLAV